VDIGDVGVLVVVISPDVRNSNSRARGLGLQDATVTPSTSNHTSIKSKGAKMLYRPAFSGKDSGANR